MISIKGNFNFRPVDLEDAKLLFDWVNDDAVRENAINQSTILWQDHLKWFKSRLKTDDCIILILEKGKVPVGQIRLDKEKEQQWIIDYSVSAENRGYGYGKILLTGAITYLKEKGIKGELVGLVKTNNTASAGAFRKSGFSESLGNEMLKFTHLI